MRRSVDTRYTTGVTYHWAREEIDSFLHATVVQHAFSCWLDTSNTTQNGTVVSACDKRGSTLSTNNVASKTTTTTN